MSAKPVAVLDADIVLARLEQGHRVHGRATNLFSRVADGNLEAFISAVNFAEVQAHSLEYRRLSGLNVISFLAASKISIHAPGVEVAERVADMAGESRLSLADRFAAATAEFLSARLYTTDAGLARAMTRRRVPVTRL